MVFNRGIAATATAAAINALCTINMPNGRNFEIPCPTHLVPRAEVTLESFGVDTSLQQHSDNSGLREDDFRDPFYATTFPICYALAATTVTAYMLVIMLFITPRSFLDGGIVYLGRRSGFSHSPASSVSIGGRPWLQKVAALTVAISLTIASADTFRVAQMQYNWSFQNAKRLQEEVLGSTELKAIRIVSDTFLWLAQAQTLIRLFPRQREKLIIKWVAFALIILDVVFSAINSFRYSKNGINTFEKGKTFVHPIPALSYLFQLSISILYAAWVIYYALMKKRYAFYHPFMRNMTLVAVISITSILIPVVFFTLDFSIPDFTGWGDYVRWVGAAAASVVVWEWVERIEALEREEKKDGILGREVFDGDDMLEVNASEFPWLRNNRKFRKNTSSTSGSDSHSNPPPTSNGWANVSALTNRYRAQNRNARDPESDAQNPISSAHPHLWPARPAPAVTPVSRTDTASAASTVYAVRYQPPSEATTRTPDPWPHHTVADLPRQTSSPLNQQTVDDAVPSNQQPLGQNGQGLTSTTNRSRDLEANSPPLNSQISWQNVPPPGAPAQPSSDGQSEEIQQQQQQQQQQTSQQEQDPAQSTEPGAARWDIRSRFEMFAANQAERFRGRMRSPPDTQSLPVTVIPAPPRRGAALQQVLEEEELAASATVGDNRSHQSNNGQSNSSSSRSRDVSDDMTQLERSRSTFSGSQGGQSPLPPNAPPLWRGVQSRYTYEDDSDEDTRSISDTSSLRRSRPGSSSSDNVREQNRPANG